MFTLLQPYLLYIRLGLIAAAVAALGLFSWQCHIWHRDSKELARERACEPHTTCAERAKRFAEAQQKAAQEQAEKAREVVITYEKELADNRNRPARVVRVCPAPSDMRDAATPGSPDGSGTPTGVVSGPPGVDIGQDLQQLAKDADEVAARLRALQEWASPK